MYEVLSVIIAVFGVLQIILFFKLWGMTNDVKTILSVLNARDNREVRLPKKAKVKGLDYEVEIVGMKDGKVLCVKGKGMSAESIAYKLEDLVLE